MGRFVLKVGVGNAHDEIARELIARVREQIGAVAAFKQVAVVARLPKTRSGKVLRATMRAIADGRDYTVPATIDDPQVLKEIAAALIAVRCQITRCGRAQGRSDERRVGTEHVSPCTHRWST